MNKVKKSLWIAFATWLPTKWYLTLMFNFRHLYRMSWTSPKTLNQKMQVWKLNSKNEFLASLVDKYQVREYVANQAGEQYIIPMILVTNDLTQEDFNSLPNNFVIKSTHGSSQVQIVRNKHEWKFQEIKKLTESWVKEDYSVLTKEFQYRLVKPRLIVEKLLLHDDGVPPNDYKFHCFNGEVEFIQVDLDRFTDHKRNYYNSNWERLPFNWSVWRREKNQYPSGDDIEPPRNLKEMNELAKKLAKPFSYVRIDLYDLWSQVYFGEITLHHGSGWERFYPEKYDYLFGDKLGESQLK